MNARRIGVRVVGATAGAVIGFFGSLNSVFSDGGTTERVTAILLTAAVVGLVSALVAALDPGSTWRIALWVWVPGALMLAAYVVLGEYSAWLWVLFVAAVTLGAGVAGALLGGARGGKPGVG